MAGMEIEVIKSISEFQWNHEVIKSWAQEYAARFANLAVTEENLKEMEEVRKEIAGKRTKLDEFRKAAKKDFEKPLKQFEAEVKDVMAVLDEVEKPIAEQIQKYEDLRREAKGKEVKGWIESMAGAAGLRDSFARLLTVSDTYTNRTATKKAITTDISQRIDALMEKQKSEDAVQEQWRQKVQMAEQLCSAQSEAFGLASRIGVSDLHNIETIQLGDLAEYIVGVAKRRKDAEDAAVRRAAPPPEPTPADVLADSAPQEAAEPAPETKQEPLYTLTMEFSRMTVAQAVKLKSFLDNEHYTYTTKEKVRVA